MKEARSTNTKLGGLPIQEKAQLTTMYEEIKICILVTVRIPLAKLKRGQVDGDKLLKMLDDQIPPGVRIDNCRVKIARGGPGQVSKLKGALFTSRCLAAGCTNSQIYEWYHVPGNKLDTYNGKADWLVEWASPNKVACRSCRTEHDLSHFEFACDAHKGDYRSKASPVKPVSGFHPYHTTPYRQKPWWTRIDPK